MKVGFVAIIGRPNVGKSTLINTLMQLDIAIVSDKPQTTRDDIKGIYNDRESQIVFVDTPGIHKPKSEFGTVLNEKAYKELEDVDLVLFLTPSNEKIGPGDQFIIDKIKDFKNKIAIITKSDLETKKEILDEKAQYLKSKGFLSVMTASTKNIRTKSQIIDLIKEYLKEGEPFYDTNTVTDRPKDFIVKEIIRESAINLLKAELPHSIAVSINEYSRKEDVVYVDAIIFVERDSQRGILIGAHASMIKEIGKRARLKLQEIIKEKVHMKLEVKVSKNWTKSMDKIRELGY